jgi:hypothetical protein
MAVKSKVAGVTPSALRRCFITRPTAFTGSAARVSMYLGTAK